jgi:hypothetical protein
MNLRCIDHFQSNSRRRPTIPYKNLTKMPTILLSQLAQNANLVHPYRMIKFNTAGKISVEDTSLGSLIAQSISIATNMWIVDRISWIVRKAAN